MKLGFMLQAELIINKSHEDIRQYATIMEQTNCQFMSSSTASECNSDTESETSAMNNKSIQIDMDCEPGDDPKKNKKYWQDVAGLRGAREQYLQLDVRDLSAEQFRQADYINYLKAKLDMATKEIRTLKAKRCRCQQDENDHEIFTNKTFSSIGL